MSDSSTRGAAIFTEVLPLQVGGRLDHLARAGGGDTELRCQVEMRLLPREQAGDFPESPQGKEATRHERDPRVGEDGRLERKGWLFAHALRDLATTLTAAAPATLGGKNPLSEKAQ